MLTHEELASHPWLSIFGPVGAGVYQCLLWAAMPITELCTRGWGIEIQWPSARMGVFLDVLQVNEGERSVVSMRDIGRAARVFKWLLDWCKLVSLLGQILYCEKLLFLFAMILWKNILVEKTMLWNKKKHPKSCEDWRKTQIWIHLGGDLGLGRWLNIIFFLLPVPRFLTSYSKLHGDSASAAVRDDKDDLLGPASCLGLAGVYLCGWKLLVVMIPIKHMVLIFNLLVEVITCYAES